MLVDIGGDVEWGRVNRMQHLLTGFRSLIACKCVDVVLKFEMSYGTFPVES